MIPTWFSHHVGRMKSRFDHHELSRQSTSSNNSSNSSASRTSPIVAKTNRSRRSKSCSSNKDFRFTQEQIDACRSTIQKRMAVVAHENLLQFAEPGAKVCCECTRRVGKFRGNTCDVKESLCKHCSYKRLLDAILNHTSGTVNNICPKCKAVNTGFIKIPRTSESNAAGDENVPAHEVSPESLEEQSITFQDYAEAMCRGDSKRAGRVNKGFESSGSI